MFVIRPESKAPRPSTFEHLKSMKIQSSVLFDIIKLFENMQLQIVMFAPSDPHIYIYICIHLYTHTCFASQTLPLDLIPKHGKRLPFTSLAMTWFGPWSDALLVADSILGRQCLAPGTLSKALFLALCSQTPGFSRIFHIFPLFRPTWFQSNLLDFWIWTQKNALRSSGQAAQLPNSSPA